MKKLFIFFLIAGMAFAIQAQDITNKLSPTGSFKVDTNDGTTSLLSVNNDGKVGVGTDNPTSTLDVNGSVTYAYAAGGTVNLTDAHYVYNCNVDQAIVTLPSASGIEGRVYIIKVTVDGQVNIRPQVDQFIDNIPGPQGTFLQEWNTMTVVSNGVDTWYTL